ncbi:MAG: hypothetical protein ACYYK0_03830 [Candidatus Eutrophobiaceae bacterium]
MRHRQSLFATLAMAVGMLCGLSACDSPKEANYFPLDAGWDWTYRALFEDSRGKQQLEKYRFGNIGWANRTGVGAVATRATPNGGQWHYRQDAMGVWYMSETEIGKGAGKVVLGLPFEAGTQWSHATSGRLLQRFWWDASSNVKVNMVHRIIATDAVVRTPAGLFRQCIEVHGEGDGFIRYGRHSVLIVLDIREKAWYAPGVGLVRFERIEKTSSSIIGDVSMEMELESVNKPST